LEDPSTVVVQEAVLIGSSALEGYLQRQTDIPSQFHQNDTITHTDGNDVVQGDRQFRSWIRTDQTIKSRTILIISTFQKYMKWA
jgi:hypothetical protein